MIELLLGIIIGLLIACFIAILLTRYAVPIHRNLSKAIDSPLISPYSKAYIAGLSDEEQSFADSINKNTDVKIS